MTPDEVMARLDPDEVRDMLAGAAERLAEPAEPDSRERLEARVAELQRRSAVTLTEFLLARIGEDEAWASGEGKRFLAGESSVIPPGVVGRFLRECEAKRDIVETCAIGEAMSNDAVTAETCTYFLRTLASIYAQHPDYREEEWRP